VGRPRPEYGLPVAVIKKIGEYLNGPPI